MSRYVFTSSGELTHCGAVVEWEDCDREHAGCYVTVCHVCSLRDYDCES